MPTLRKDKGNRWMARVVIYKLQGRQASCLHDVSTWQEGLSIDGIHPTNKSQTRKRIQKSSERSTYLNGFREAFFVGDLLETKIPQV